MLMRIGCIFLVCALATFGFAMIFDDFTATKILQVGMVGAIIGCIFGLAGLAFDKD